MDDKRVRGLQQEVDEIGSLLAGTVQQVNERTEQVPEMMDRLQTLTEDCERFHRKQTPMVSKEQQTDTSTVTNTNTSPITSTRCKVTLCICLAMGLIMIILICVASIHTSKEEDKGAEEGTELMSNFTQPGA